MDNKTTVTIQPDPRGESESYLPIMLVCQDESGRRVWHEGIRKDWRVAMLPPFAAMVSEHLSAEASK